MSKYYKNAGMILASALTVTVAAVGGIHFYYSEQNETETWQFDGDAKIDSMRFMGCTSEGEYSTIFQTNGQLSDIFEQSAPAGMRLEPLETLYVTGLQGRHDLGSVKFTLNENYEPIGTAEIIPASQSPMTCPR